MLRRHRALRRGYTAAAGSDPRRAMAPIRHKRLAETVGDWFGLLTVAGMAAGLAERLDQEQW